MPQESDQNPVQAILSGDPETARLLVEQIVEATSDALISLNDQFVVTWFNRKAESLLPNVGTIAGCKLWEAFPQSPSSDSNFRPSLERSMKERVPQRFEASFGDAGSLWYEVNAVPSADGLLLFFRDITGGRASREELQRKTEEVERQLAEIESLYRTAPIGLALFSVPDFRYLRCNERQASFFGMTPSELLGRTVTEMAPIEVVQGLFERVAGGEPVVAYPLEGRLVGKPDHYGYWTCNYYPVYGPDGKVEAISAASLEITGQKQVENALIESDKLAAVGRLASSIAHEINNPLEAVTNLLYLARITPERDDARRFVEQAEGELHRIAEITSQTLRFHKQASHPQAVAAKDLVESVHTVYRGKLMNACVSLEQSHRQAPPVHCFEGEIRQVLSNLVGNALDAMPIEGGKIVLKTHTCLHPRTGQREVAITVADNGSGMTEATLEQAFRPFFTTKGILGTGLGLWISQEIVHRHGGRLRVRSRRDRGTVFLVSLPYNAVSRTE